MRETWVRSLVQKIPWRRKWQPIPVFLPGESQGRGSLVGYSPQGRKESDTAERLHFHLESMKTKSFIELLNFENTLQISIWIILRKFYKLLLASF